MTANGARVVAIGAAAQIFRSHLRGLVAVDARVVGVQDVNQERLQPVTERLGCPAFEDVGALLQTRADLAVITAPHPFHAGLTKGRLELIRNEVDVRDYAVSPGNPYDAPPALDPEIVTGENVSHPALVTLELTNALTYSARTGQEVRLPLDRAAYGELLRSLRD